MFFEQYGDSNNPIIVFLHGANFIHSFGRQYCLADKYYLVVPHIMGFGNEADKTFESEQAISELAEFIKSFNRQVTLIGFSLGAQLAVKLIVEYFELFNGAIIVSPWLTKDENTMSEIMHKNEKQLQQLKNKRLCTLIGLLNGLPKAQLHEFVDQMQNVSSATVKNTVDNGITLDTVRGFAKASIPIVAIAGEKEMVAVKDSVSGLAKMNTNCEVQIWEKAAHNIPPVFYKRFNCLICEMLEKIQKDTGEDSVSSY